MGQGSCVQDAGVFGCLDRLAALEQVISQADVEQSLFEAGKIQSRECPLSYSVLVWIVLAMGVFTDVPIREVFRLSRAFQPGKNLPSRSALCRGRKRVGSHVIRLLFLRVVCLLGTPDVPGCFYKGYRLMGIDGSIFTIPDTAANERAFVGLRVVVVPKAKVHFPK